MNNYHTGINHQARRNEKIKPVGKAGIGYIERLAKEVVKGNLVFREITPQPTRTMVDKYLTENHYAQSADLKARRY